MEPHDNQELLEANVTVAGNQLALTLNNMVVVDALYRLPPYIYTDRGCLPMCLVMTTLPNRRVMQGILTRIRSCSLLAVMNSQ